MPLKLFKEMLWEEDRKGEFALEFSQRLHWTRTPTLKSVDAADRLEAAHKHMRR